MTNPDDLRRRIEEDACRLEACDKALSEKYDTLQRIRTALLRGGGLRFHAEQALEYLAEQQRQAVRAAIEQNRAGDVIDVLSQAIRDLTEDA